MAADLGAPPPYTVTGQSGMPGNFVEPPACIGGDRPPSYTESQLASSAQMTNRPKRILIAYILGIPLGMFGAHHFYLNRKWFGLLYLCTLGLLGFGWIIDLFRMKWIVESSNMRIRKPKYDTTRTTMDAYTLWLGPLGILGLHHYYLNNPRWGMLCTLTGSFLGTVWLYDAVKISFYVRETNRASAARQYAESILGVSAKTLNKAVALGASPLGIFGAHHFYLDRFAFGLLYAVTLGLGGVGWLGDLFRMHTLVQRANQTTLGRNNPNYKHLDDAYFLLFPFGLLGLHQFYLYRPGMGMLYFCTFGCFGVGWVIDMFILPKLVEEANARFENEQYLDNQNTDLSVTTHACSAQRTDISFFETSNIEGIIEDISKRQEDMDDEFSPITEDQGLQIKFYDDSNLEKQSNLIYTAADSLEFRNESISDYSIPCGQAVPQQTSDTAESETSEQVFHEMQNLRDELNQFADAFSQF